MKRLLLLFLAAVAAFGLLTLPASADFTDDCVSAQNDGWHTYHNLSATPAGPAVDFDWPAAPDRTALALQSAQAGPASALYAVDSAQGITVTMYAIFATFSTEQNGGPMLGYPAGGSASSAKPLFYAENTGRVYLNSGGWRALERDPFGEIVFTPLSSAPSGTLVPYGLSVACSPDGSSFSSVPVTLRAAQCSLEDGPGFACYYETYSAPIPPGTRLIRLELREMSFFPLTDGGTVTNNTRGSMRLASVTFTGNAVRGSLSGEPPVAPSSSSSSVSSSTSSSQSASLSDPDLQTSSPHAGETGGGAGYDEDRKPSRASRSSREASSRSSTTSRAASSRASSRASTKGATVSSSTSSATSVTHAPEAEGSQEEPASVTREERSAAPRTTDARTLLLGGGYLVFACALLIAIARRK